MANLPDALGFLNEYFVDPAKSYRTASWLLTDFDDAIWQYDFGFQTPQPLDWRIKLIDDTSLTDPKNESLLTGFRYYLISSTRSATILGNDVGSLGAQQQSFHRCVNIIDYILLNQSEYQIAKFGLAAINGNHLIGMLNQITQSSDTAESVYNWTQCAADYCQQLLHETPPDQIDKILKLHPGMTLFSPEQLDDNTFPIEREMLARARAALFINNLYAARNCVMDINTARLSRIIFKDTLKGKQVAKPRLLALQYGESSTEFSREYPRVGVRSDNDSTMSGPRKQRYRMSIYGMGTLHETGIPAPNASDLAQLLSAPLEGRKLGRFKTMPFRVVFSTIRAAVEFHIEYGQILTTGFCNIAKYCKANDLTFNQLSSDNFNEAAGSDLLNIGVSKIGLSCKIKGVHKRKGSRKKGVTEYFNQLRSNHPLLELLAVYVGSVQIVVGAIMARRFGEMLDLHTLTCLDISKRWLIFKNRKSTKNLYGIRNTEARPVEPIAVEMIETLTNMHSQLLANGCIEQMQHLFSAPSLKGDLKLLEPDGYSYNRNIDLACDYFQTELNKSGERYYIRQHQLRRFFAMLFFHGSSFGGLDVLRWMLAHTDLNHVWNYITESMDGAILTGAKAQFLAESLYNNGTGEYEDLAALLKSRYGTDNFALIDTDELEAEIEELMKSGEITIEPEFLDSYDNQRMKVIVKVLPAPRRLKY